MAVLRAATMTTSLSFFWRIWAFAEDMIVFVFEMIENVQVGGKSG
jgi:hypothetical protein